MFKDSRLASVVFVGDFTLDDGTIELANTYFLSTLGSIINFLSEDEMERLIIRLLLRGKLVKRLIRATNNGIVDVRKMLYKLILHIYGGGVI